MSTTRGWANTLDASPNLLLNFLLLFLDEFSSSSPLSVCLRLREEDKGGEVPSIAAMSISTRLGLGLRLGLRLGIRVRVRVRAKDRVRVRVRVRIRSRIRIRVRVSAECMYAIRGVHMVRAWVRLVKIAYTP